MAELNEKSEGIGVIPTRLHEFYEDVEKDLMYITGLFDMEEDGLSLEECRFPYLIVGSPGIGKTAGIIAAREKINRVLESKGMSDRKLGWKKIELGRHTVGDFTGIPVPVQDRDGNAKLLTLQVEDLPVVERDGEYGVLFLDEFTTVDEQQMQPAMGLCDDSRGIGQYRLPEHWLVIAAGNGPESTNFMRLDDAMLSRFNAYEVNYSYDEDWRPWALKNGICEEILAFLSFKPENMIRIESNDMHEAGKSFATPRTWTLANARLKKIFAAEKRSGKKIRGEALAAQIAHNIGRPMAREFSSFVEFKDTVKYSAEKIYNGVEADPQKMQDEEFHLLLESCVFYGSKLTKPEVDTQVSQGTAPTRVKFSDDTINKLINMFDWLMKLEASTNRTDFVARGIYTLMYSIPGCRPLMNDPRFISKCSSVRTHIANNKQLYTKYAGMLKDQFSGNN